MRTLDQILTDATPTFRELHRIASNQGNTLETRARAIRKFDDLTGTPESAKFGNDDVALVADYERWMLEELGVAMTNRGRDA